MAAMLIKPFLGPESVPIKDCAWKYTFDNDERNYYHQGLVITGIISQFFTLWLNFSLTLTGLWKDDDYRNFSIFTICSFLRKVASGLVSLPALRNIDSWFRSNLLYCVILAYQDGFYSVLELESLTHVCIARYVMARYASNKWPMNKHFNHLYIVSTVLFAIVYTYIPILGYGGSCYYDFPCSTCTFDMLLPDNYEQYIVLTLIFMRSIKPVLVMMISLIWAYNMDKNVCTDPDAPKRLTFTRNLMIITAVMLMCWLPLGVIRGYVIIGQLFYDKVDIIISMAGLGETINWTMLLYWISPAYMVITLMFLDNKIRYNMIHLTSAVREAAELADREAENAEQRRRNQMEKQKGKKKN